LSKWTPAAGAVLALFLSACGTGESAAPAPAEAFPAATAPGPDATVTVGAATPREPGATPAKVLGGVNAEIFGRVELLAPGEITVTPPEGAGQAAFLSDDTVLLVAYGKCPDGSGTETETVDAMNRGTKQCSVKGLEEFLRGNPLSGDVAISGGVVVKIVEHKGG